VGPILFTLNESIGESTNFSMVNVCTFLFLKLSGERDFAIALNRPNKSNEYLGLMRGSLADLMVQVFMKVIKQGPAMEGIAAYLLIVLSNISAFVKGLNLQSGKSLVSVLSRIIEDEWLLKTETRHHLIFYIMETINN
jgi:hypothetical protein